MEITDQKHALGTAKQCVHHSHTYTVSGPKLFVSFLYKKVLLNAVPCGLSILLEQQMRVLYGTAYQRKDERVKKVHM